MFAPHLSLDSEGIVVQNGMPSWRDCVKNCSPGAGRIEAINIGDVRIVPMRMRRAQGYEAASWLECIKRVQGAQGIQRSGDATYKRDRTGQLKGGGWRQTNISQVIVAQVYRHGHGGVKKGLLPLAGRAARVCLPCPTSRSGD